MDEPVCVFRAGETLFVCPLTYVAEVIEVPSVTIDSAAPQGVRGATNVRGSLACVLDVVEVFGLGRTEGSLAVVFKCSGRTVVVPIDEVLDVTRVDLGTSRALPVTAAESLRAACSGVVLTSFGWACALDITKAVVA